MLGPTTRRAPRDIDCRTLADCSMLRGTSCGMIAANAGNTSASVRPLRASSTISIHSSAVSVMTSVATIPCVAARTRPPTRRIRTRGSRSAITPPKSRNSTSGIELAASTAPRAVGESETSSTANASATGAIVVRPC